MSMVHSSLFSSDFIPHLSPIKCSSTSLTSLHSYFPPIQFRNSKRDFPLATMASITYPPSINMGYWESEELSGYGLTFEELSDNCGVVRMALDNGSVATLMLPSGLITSYKASMWHGGILELLHTSVSEVEKKKENEDDDDDVIQIQGGVSLAFNCESDSGVSWSPNTWALGDVRGSPQDSIRVELVCSNSQDMIEVKHILTLQQDLLSSELLISNSKHSSLRLTGSITSHLTVSTPEATYAIGLEGSNFYNKPPFSSKFSIIPPESTKRNDLGSKKSWKSPTAVKQLLSAWGSENRSNEMEREEEMEGEENDNYKHLTDKMSRIYTSAPRYFTIIDRGRRNSVAVGRDGFNELYMFSPGSSHEWYGKYAYLCVGQSALLKPIILGPGGEWRGSQHLQNPNL
ncbi:hypothetical protein CsSME_00046467 [Camellia sinensis var. sinensis]